MTATKELEKEAAQAKLNLQAMELKQKAIEILRAKFPELEGEGDEGLSYYHDKGGKDNSFSTCAWTSYLGAISTSCESARWSGRLEGTIRICVSGFRPNCGGSTLPDKNYEGISPANFDDTMSKIIKLVEKRLAFVKEDLQRETERRAKDAERHAAIQAAVTAAKLPVYCAELVGYEKRKQLAATPSLNAAGQLVFTDKKTYTLNPDAIVALAEIIAAKGEINWHSTLTVEEWKLVRQLGQPEAA